MDEATQRNATYLKDTQNTLSIIDRNYTTIGCIGIGGFGSVFLATKKSGRKVALKVMPMDTSDDDDYEQFCREIESVHNLNEGIDNSNRDMHIIFFEDWFISRNFVCIVMQYADGKWVCVCYDSLLLYTTLLTLCTSFSLSIGGTLAQEIERMSNCYPLVPYSERRIAWYTLQVC